MTESFFFLILKVLWLFLPASFAHMSPIIAKKIFPKWTTAVDFGNSWHGQEIFGSHKTYRGLISGVVIGLLVFTVQQNLYSLSPEIRRWSVFDYQTVSPLFGALIGFGALAGDLLKSFFKRRFGISSGRPWIPFDQIDWILGALLSLTLVFVPSLEFVLISLLVLTVLDFAMNFIGYHLGLKSAPL